MNNSPPPKKKYINNNKINVRFLRKGLREISKRKKLSAGGHTLSSGSPFIIKAIFHFATQPPTAITNTIHTIMYAEPCHD